MRYRRIPTILITSVATIAAIATLSACFSSPPPSPPPSSDSAPATGGELTASTGTLSRDQLGQAGISIVDAETDVTGTPTSLTLTSVQADRLVAEVAAGAGTPGSDLDAVAPPEEGLPPASYLLAAYVSQSDLPGARIARMFYATDTDWTHAGDVAFPAAVLALLTADLMSAAQQAGSFEAGSEGLGVSGPLVSPAFAAGGMAPGGLASAGFAPGGLADAPCSTVTTFLSKSIQALFDVLRVLPNEVGRISELGPLGIILSALISGAIGLAQGVVQGVVAVLTRPVLNAMRTAFSALGVASLVLSYFTNEKLVVKPAPGTHRTFSIDPAPGERGTFTASTLSLTKDWPAALVDCASASGAKIPKLIAVGDPVTWAQATNPQLITPDALSSKVTSERTATMDFTAGHEDAETAKGPERTEASRVTVSIPRKEVGDFLDLAANEIQQVKNDILSNIPSIVRGTADKAISAILDPTIANITRSVKDSVGGILTLRGEGSVFVTHHSPKEPDPSAEPSPADGDEGDFCAEFDQRAQTAVDTLPGASDLFAWGGAFGADLASIEATPPADLATDFDMIVEFYTLVGTLSIQDTQPLADFVGSHDIDTARVHVWGVCGAPKVEGF